MGNELKPEKKEEASYLLAGIPIHAYRLFQSRCALQGKKIKDVLIEFIKGYGE